MSKESRAQRAKRKKKMLELRRKGVPTPPPRAKRLIAKPRVRKPTETMPDLYIINKPKEVQGK